MFIDHELEIFFLSSGGAACSRACFETLRSAGAKGLWLVSRSYKHPAPPELTSFWLRLHSRAMQSLCPLLLCGKKSPTTTHHRDTARLLAPTKLSKGARTRKAAKELSRKEITPPNFEDFASLPLCDFASKILLEKQEVGNL